MKQINKLKMIAAMAVSILSFTITSCSSDDFYGFEQNSYSNAMSYYDIIHSPELVAYMSEFYNYVKNDTTKNLTKNNKKLDIDEKSFIIRRYYDLIEKYPEFEYMMPQERIDVCNKCINNSPDLRKLYGRKSFIRTKGENPENNTAWKSLANTTNSSITRAVNCEYDFLYNGKVRIYVFDDPTGAVSFATVTAMSGVDWNDPQPEQFKEVSGYIYNNSSVALDDPDATNHNMAFVMWAWGRYHPDTYFHIHPNAGFTMDSLPHSYDELDAADKAAKSAVNSNNCSGFKIYNLNNQCVSF